MKLLPTVCLALGVLAALGSSARADPRVVRERVRASLDPAERTVEGLAELTVDAGGGGVLALELASSLRVTSVFLDDAPVEQLVDSDEGARLTVWRFPVPRRDAGHVVVSVAWSGTYAPPPGATFDATLIDLPESARWAPTPQLATTWDVTLELPADLHAVMRGAAGARSEHAGRATQTFTARLPARGLPLAAGRWQPLTARVGGTSVTVWGPPADADILDAARSAIERLSAVLGPCPAARFDVVPRRALLAASAPGLGSRGWGDLATQVARCWFGLALRDDGGTARWADPLALYAARQLVVEDQDPDAALAFRRAAAAALSATTSPADDHRRVLAFHALRRELGRPAFEAALRALLRDHVGGIATWDDFTAAFSAAAGRDMTAPVAQWTRRGGAPLLTLENAQLATSGGRLRLTGTIRQSVPAGEAPWRLRVPLEIELLNSRETIVVDASGERTAFNALLPGLPVRVTLDPGLDVPRRLSRNPGEEPLTGSRQLLPDVRSAADVDRVAALAARIAGAADDRAARRAIIDDLRIAGLDAALDTHEVEVRARDAEDVVAVAGDAVAGCRPLTCSPQTPEGGTEVAGVSSEPADDLTGRALVVDVPPGTPDLVAFARGFAGIAQGAGAAALVLRLPVDAKAAAAMAGAWTTPAESGRGGHTAVLAAWEAQRARGDDLALPTIAAPHDFAPTGSFRVRVRWRPATARVSAVRATVKAGHGRRGPIVIAAYLTAPAGGLLDLSAATSLAEAAQLLAPHAALLGRDVVFLFVPLGRGAAVATADLTARWGAPPAAVMVVSGMLASDSPAGVGHANDAADVAGVLAACLRRTAIPVAADGPVEIRLGSPFAWQTSGEAVLVPTVMTFQNGLTEAGARPPPAAATRLARAVALAALAASVLP